MKSAKPYPIVIDNFMNCYFTGPIIVKDAARYT
uniref:Peptidase A1 domain-containing protein n=1 Tax=Heterorhabditis bacteriophora TaxID=37862 RepID=A0A1I7WZ04_HETBA